MFKPKAICPFVLVISTSLATAQWSAVPSPGDRIFCFAAGSEGRLFAGTENSGLWVSDDGGGTFAVYPTGLAEMNFDVTTLLNKSGALWAGMYGGGVARSTDGGTSWTSFNDGFQTQSMVVGLSQIGDTVYAAVDYVIGLQASGVYKSAVDEPNWQRTGTGFPANLSGITSFDMTNSNVMFAGAALAGVSGNVQVSTDKGQTWLNRAITGVSDVVSLETDGEAVFAGTSDGIYVSRNNGETWQRAENQFQGRWVDRLLLVDGRLLAAIDGIGAALGSESGAWSVITGNLPIENDYVSALFVYDQKLFAGLSASQGPWWMPFLATQVEATEPWPGSVNLAQNYPNPFNPETKIRFTLTKAGHVSLKVYDLLGREVATLLAQEKREAGEHAVIFQAHDLPSGIYWYRMTAGDFTQARKMMLIR